jgi:hypothetical protein
VNDNAFTYLMARLNLDCAGRGVHRLEAEYPWRFVALRWLGRHGFVRWPAAPS